MSWKQIIIWLSVWRVAITLAALAGVQFLPFKPSFPYRDVLLEPYGNPLLYSWANFDGVHYLHIAQSGYFADFTQAFFPIYPFLIKYFGYIIPSHLLVGLLISHLSLALSLWFLYRLLRLDYSDLIAKRTLAILLAFPTSFFFGSLYTESLFLLLMVASLYLVRQKFNSGLAGAVGMVASATRVIGATFTPMLLIEYWQTYQPKTKKDWLKALPLLISGLGLLLYMYYLWQTKSDPLYFLSAQPAFGASRSADKLILLYQVIYRYLRMLFLTDTSSYIYYNVNLEFWISMLFLGLLSWATWKRSVRWSYLSFGWIAYILPTLTGTFSSMPRYVLLILPGFILLAMLPKTLYRVVWLIFAGLLLINTALFIQGYWIA